MKNQFDTGTIKTVSDVSIETGFCCKTQKTQKSRKNRKKSQKRSQRNQD